MDAHPDARLPDDWASARLKYPESVTTLTLTPAQAAERLQVSSTALRRASPVYEQHFGPLPREARGGRLWTAEALEHMRLAFDAVHRNQMVSISAALEVLSSGSGLPVVQASGRVDGSTDELLRELLAEVRVSRTENANLVREVAALRAEVASWRILPVISPPADKDQGAPTEAGGERRVRRSPEGPSRGSENLDGVTVLRVVTVEIPQRLKNTLRWAPSRYTDLEAVLSSTLEVRLERINGKDVWRIDSGDHMRKDTVLRLVGAGVLVAGLESEHVNTSRH